MHPHIWWHMAQEKVEIFAINDLNLHNYFNLDSAQKQLCMIAGYRHIAQQH